MEERFDGMFMTVVNDSKGIDGFLSNLFSFMRRKTDFFSTPDSAREYVLKYFEEQNRMYQDNKRKEEQKQKHREEQKKREEEKKKAEDAKKNAKVVEITDEEAEAINSGKPVVKEEPKPLPVAKVQDVKKEEGKADEPKDDDDKGLIPVNNGSVTDQYIWTQTLTEVTVNIFIPTGFASKCFKVNVTPTHLKITLNGNVHLEGEFHQKIKADQHVWVIDTFEKRRCIILTFEKFENQSWWKCVLKGEEEINTRKVEPENSQLSDLDDETRPTVEKMMLDMRRKAAGLPSLEEEKNRDLLKGFMDKHPEMDFSKCKITGPGQNNFGNGFNFNG
jgi:hypothetical protein